LAAVVGTTHAQPAKIVNTANIVAKKAAAVVYAQHQKRKPKRKNHN